MSDEENTQMIVDEDIDICCTQQKQGVKTLKKTVQKNMKKAVPAPAPAKKVNKKTTNDDDKKRKRHDDDEEEEEEEEEKPVVKKTLKKKVVIEEEEEEEEEEEKEEEEKEEEKEEKPKKEKKVLHELLEFFEIEEEKKEEMIETMRKDVRFACLFVSHRKTKEEKALLALEKEKKKEICEEGKKCKAFVNGVTDLEKIPQSRLAEIFSGFGEDDICVFKSEGFAPKVCSKDCVTAEGFCKAHASPKKEMCKDCSKKEKSYVEHDFTAEHFGFIGTSAPFHHPASDCGRKMIEAFRKKAECECAEEDEGTKKVSKKSRTTK